MADALDEKVHNKQILSPSTCGEIKLTILEMWTQTT